MPTEVNKCIFRGSNSAILNFAALVNGVQLLLKVHILPLTPLWKSFVSQGRKEEVNKKLFPFVKMAGKSSMVYSDNYLNKVVSHILAIRCNINMYMCKEHQVSISSPFEALAVPVIFFYKV